MCSFWENRVYSLVNFLIWNWTAHIRKSIKTLTLIFSKNHTWKQAETLLLFLLMEIFAFNSDWHLFIYIYILYKTKQSSSLCSTKYIKSKKLHCIYYLNLFICIYHLYYHLYNHLYNHLYHLYFLNLSFAFIIIYNIFSII